MTGIFISRIRDRYSTRGKALFLGPVLGVDLYHQPFLLNQIQTSLKRLPIPILLKIEDLVLLSVHIDLVHMPDDIDASGLYHFHRGIEETLDKQPDISPKCRSTEWAYSLNEPSIQTMFSSTRRSDTGRKWMEPIR